MGGTPLHQAGVSPSNPYPTYVLPVSNSTTLFTANFNPYTGCESDRDPVMVTVQPIPSLMLTPANYEICSHETVAALTAASMPLTNLIITASSDSWISGSLSSGNFDPASSLAHTLVNTSDQAGIVQYNMVPVTNGCQGSSQQMFVRVKPRPGFLTTLSDQTVCSGETLALNPAITLQGSNVKWVFSINRGLVLGANASSASSFTQTLTNVSTAQATVNYSIVPTKDGCDGESRRFDVFVDLPSSAGTISGPQTVFAEQNQGTLLLNENIGQVVSWTSASGGTIQEIPLNDISFDFTNLTESTQYKATVKNGACPAVESMPFSVTLEPLPIILASSRAVVFGAPVTLSTATEFTSYQWKDKDGTLLSTDHQYTTSSLGEYYLTVTKDAVTGEGISKVYQLRDQLSGVNENYVEANTILAPDVTELLHLRSLSRGSRSQNVSYFDGLGRLVQAVSTQASPAQKDVVQTFTYDSHGREPKKYLPVTTSMTDGWYKYDLTDSTGNYVTNANFSNPYANGANDKITDDPRPYSETIFEASPLNRPLKDYGPGADWHANHKFVEHAYLINRHGTASGHEKIIAWAIGTTTNPVMRSAPLAGYIEPGGYYATGQLQIKSTKDEQGNETREYTDKEGKTILKKVQATAAGATNLNDPNGWALTYYVYDDFGNLRFVLPPELSKLIHQNDTYNPTPTDLGRWAFIYRYDGRRRMAVKKVPGADSVYMVYDNRDRLVLTQDGNQRAGATNAIKYWTFTKYDELNRPILTGIKDTTTTVQLSQAQMQAVVNAYYANMTTTTWRKWGETYVGNMAGNVHGYTNRSYPVRTGAATEVDPNKYLTATYYDNYTFRSTWIDNNYSYVDENLSEASHGYTYHQPDAENLRVIGQVTGTKTKVLDGNIGTARSGGYTWLKNITYYDDKYRAIQIIADNYKGGTDRVTNVYDFTGKVLESQSTHTEADLTWTSPVSIVASGNKLQSIATTSGAASIQQLAAGQNGWIEAIYSENNTTRFFGLNDANPDAASANINYAFRFTTASTVNVVENGTTKATITGVAAGDVFRIIRTGTAVTYTRNGNPITLSTASTASSTLLMADLSLTSNNATLVGLRSSFSTTTQTTTRRFEYDHAGRLLNTWHKLNSGPDILLVKNEYNELGQLVDKKLHVSSPSGGGQEGVAKQSIDYRYNIRGWLTHINNAQVNVNTATNDDPNDLFGMELLYNQPDTDFGNAPLYNGNISATKWSSPMGLGTVKEKGYAYAYDELNRLKTSAYKEEMNGWITPAASIHAETGFNYDLNGNILNLKRNETAANVWMDNLAYSYTGNQLMRVTDTGDRHAGFIDGNAAATDDYTYDPNGNLTHDLNKGIGINLTDATNLIRYNFLNLPETVTKGSNSVRYIYDATGRKLAQTTTFGTRVTTTDYAGEFVYEDDVLQFIQHEEGRIVVAQPKPIYHNPATALTEFTPVVSTVATVTQSGSDYIRATVSGTTAPQGLFPIGGTITVQPGERYRIRAKGYRVGTSPAAIMVKVNNVNVDWPGAALPLNLAAEAWAEQTVTIPAGAANQTLQAGVMWNTVAAGHTFHLNEFEIIKLEATAPEYQYHLKDHLGNTRLTFTSKEETESATATLETAAANAEQSQFLRYANAKRINSALFDRTNGASPGYSQRLNGSTNERYGIARSISVMPGDVIDAEVYVKYVDLAAVDNTTAAGQALLGLLNQINQGVAGVVVDGTQYAGSTASFPASMLGHQTTTDNGSPRAYLNWLVFDRNYAFLTGGFKQVTTAASETGTDKAHEKLQMHAPITITQPGYVYIYLSNESPTLVEVFFDDFKVTHTKGPVIQTDDYYPFGFTFNSYQRENSTANQYKFSGKEEQDELGLGWLDFEARMYDASIGRFNSVDPLALKYFNMTPYNYVGNNPLNFIDPDGREIIGVTKDDAKKVHDDLNTIFADEKFAAFRGLITQSGKKGDGKKFNKIDSKALAGALEGVELSADEQAMVDMVTNTINSEDQHVIEFVDKKDNISTGGANALSGELGKLGIDIGKTTEKYGGVPGWSLALLGGGGVTVGTNGGTHSVIIQDAIGGGTDYINSLTNQPVNSPGGRAATTGHELFGHGRSLALGRSSSQHVDAVQTENLILRVMGNGNVQRNGTGHADGSRISNPSALPGFR